MYNNKYLKILYTLLFLNILNINNNIVNSSISGSDSGNDNNSGKEFRLTTFLNPSCQGLPSITLSSTTCSPDNYFQLLNESMISNTNINSNIRNCNSQYADSHPYDTFPINQCITVDQDDKYSYSIIMTTNNLTNPRSIDGYCNQFNFFDCNNYNIVSFKNGSCFIYDDYHIKQTCDEDFINTYKCNDNCLDKNCHLDKREPNNVDNDCNKKSIKINQLKVNYNTIKSSSESSKNNIINNNSEIINIEEQDKMNNLNNLSNEKNSSSSNINQNHKTKQQMDNHTFERFNNSSRLNSNNLLIILISIIIIIATI